MALAQDYPDAESSFFKRCNMQRALIITLALLSPMAVLAQAKQKITTTEVVEALPENLTSPQQVYVVQQNPQQTVQAAPQQVIRTQPVTVVEDTPLRESKAEALRRNRVEVEQETETRIVEKLESERMRAEKERADKIMQSLEGKKEEAPVVQAAPPVVAPVQPSPFQYPAATMQPVQVAAPVQVVEASSSVSSESIKEELKKDEEKPKFYIGGLGGFADYPGYKNIQGKYAAGFNVGIQFPERFIVEGSLIFSKYDLELVPSGYGSYYNYGVSEFMDIKQTNISGALKYRVLEGRISPVVGVLAGYTRRDYSMIQRNNYNSYYYSTQPNNITSNAFDMGISGGMAVDLSKNFALDMDVKYMFNLSYDVDSAYKTSLVNNQANSRKSPEELDYVIIGVGGRLTF